MSESLQTELHHPKHKNCKPIGCLMPICSFVREAVITGLLFWREGNFGGKKLWGKELWEEGTLGKENWGKEL